jgi:endonuclease/exonuclease/phosphatase family metal-dependent hydrolase
MTEEAGNLGPEQCPDWILKQGDPDRRVFRRSAAMSASSVGEVENLTDFQQSLSLERIYLKGQVPASQPGSDKGSVRVLSWNIEYGHDPAQLAETIASIAPDIACLQEVDWGCGRTGSVDVLETVARYTGMQGLYTVEFLEMPSPSRASRLRGGGATGNALLTRLQPKSAFRVDLPITVDWHPLADRSDLPKRVRRRISREPRIGRRCAIGAEFRVGTRNLLVSSMHLEDKFGGVSGRWSQYSSAVREVESRRGSSGIGVAAGDFNTLDSRLARLLYPDTDQTALGKPRQTTEASWWKNSLLPGTGYSDPFSPSDWTLQVPPFFRAKLDWITTRGAKVHECGVGSLSGSDHRPIWVDIAAG